MYFSVGSWTFIENLPCCSVKPSHKNVKRNKSPQGFFKITVQCKLLHRKSSRFISQQLSNTDHGWRGLGLVSWCTRNGSKRSLSLLVEIKKTIKKGLTTAPTVCTWQQFFWCLISIRLLCAQTEAAYRYRVGTRLETKRQDETQLTYVYSGFLFTFQKA